jgi:hypothetical protein
LTNFQLLVLALIPVTGAVWLSVKRTSAAAAPAVLAVIMLLLALGGPVWEWSKDSEGAGLPPQVKAAAFGESTAVPAFLWASIGAGLSALLVPPVPLQALPARKVMPSRNVSILVAVLSAVAFVALLVGQGPSFLRREEYLQVDGPVFLLKASYFGMVFGVIGIALIAWVEDRRLRHFLIATSALWFIGPLCTGSREACAVPIVGSAVIIYNEIRRRRLHLPLIAAALALLVTAFFSFSVVNKAREMPHGLLNLPNVVQATASDMLNSTDSVLLPVKRLVASVFAAFPVAEESVRSGVDSGVLLGNANPLPGTSQSSDLERYWPYEWTPLAFAGEWFGAMGWVGQILIFGAMGWIFGLTMHNLQRSRFRVISFLPLFFVALIGFESIEYSSRMVWRVISISLITFIASYLVKERSRYMVRGTRDEQPRNAIGELEESATRVLTRVATRVAMTIGHRYG